LELLARNTSRLPAWVRPLAEGDAGAVVDLGRVLRDYHAAAIAPHHELIQDGVAADHAYRVRALSSSGLDGMFATLRPMMDWRPPVLHVTYLLDRDLHLRG